MVLGERLVRPKQSIPISLRPWLTPGQWPRPLAGQQQPDRPAPRDRGSTERRRKIRSSPRNSPAAKCRDQRWVSRAWNGQNTGVTPISLSAPELSPTRRFDTVERRALKMRCTQAAGHPAAKDHESETVREAAMDGAERMRRQMGVAFLVAATVCCGTAVFARGPSVGLSGDGGAAVGLSPVESAIIARTNAARSQRGQPPLTPDGSLMQGARRQARWMAGSQTLEHGQGVAENIGMGQTSAAEAVSSWMNSSGHRANILDSGHTKIGVAMARAADGSAYWCQQFR